MSKSKAYISTSESDSDEAPKSKKTKSTKGSEKRSKVAKASASGTDNETMIEIGRLRYATVSEFRGKKMVNIREYYEADGQLKPGKKGIALTTDQWEKLKRSISEIDDALAEL